MEEGICGLEVCDYGGRHRERGPVGRGGAVEGGAFGGGEEGREAVVVVRIDDAISGGVGRMVVVGVRCFHDVCDFLQEQGEDGRVDESVVRCNACLAGVEEFAPGDAFRGLSDVGALHDDGGAFPSEFEIHGGQMFGCGGHDGFAYGWAAGEEDVAERVLE